MAEEQVKVEAAVEQKPAERRPFHRDGKRPFRKDGKRFDKPEKVYEEKVIYINRVSKTVKGGRRMRFAALVAVGDGRGNVGYANAKASEVPDAIKKATEAAKKNMQHISVVKGDTISHEIVGKYGACGVFLKPAHVGTGVIAGGPVRAILELAGIKNIYSKVYGSRTAINIVRATMIGLTSLKTVTKVATLRGKKPQEIK